MRDRLAALEERVAALEAKAAGAAGRGAGALLDTIRTEDRGRIAYAGAAGVGAEQYQWTREWAVPDVLVTDWSSVARTLESVGSAARLTLLAALLNGLTTRTELQAALGETSTGHLYHHLRELHGAGLVHQRHRGEYALAPQAVVPLLTIMAAARDLVAQPPEES